MHASSFRRDPGRGGRFGRSIQRRSRFGRTPSSWAFLCPHREMSTSVDPVRIVTTGATLASTPSGREKRGFSRHEATTKLTAILSRCAGSVAVPNQRCGQREPFLRRSDSTYQPFWVPACRSSPSSVCAAALTLNGSPCRTTGSRAANRRPWNAWRCRLFVELSSRQIPQSISGIRCALQQAGTSSRTNATARATFFRKSASLSTTARCG